MTYKEMAKTMDQFPEVVDGISQLLSAIAQDIEVPDHQLLRDPF